MTEPNLQEIEQFLYREARLLDNRQFHQWLELLAEDVRYWMPSSLDEAQQDPRDLTEPDELVVIDEDMDSLRRRIERLDSGFAWAEDPPSRTRHFISNVELESTESPDEVKVYSNFIMYRTRGEREEDFYVGSREDILRRSEKGWLIAYRRIILDQTVISAKNVSNFF
ncbi:3-phenylpropionate/cinnamic acid dioxygenase subunit beta [Geodia barretti]|uniref:3-phenylpropionate/cinnamic acid dioxygenase subunit beta n=1 Tax=Geodia barretti TaxID=519541 RepID=A0AA35T9B8_GEOBA|nr:3-phenylpropionate/cinnamic acid dioxygenase subunit beta [Geodia barretti]